MDPELFKTSKIIKIDAIAFENGENKDFQKIGRQGTISDQILDIGTLNESATHLADS